jgi:hypothetical protein
MAIAFPEEMIEINVQGVRFKMNIVNVIAEWKGSGEKKV